MSIVGLSAVTLVVRDMARSVSFYQALGFELKFGGGQSDFTSFVVGTGYLNLVVNVEAEWRFWGRAIFYVDDVDAQYRLALQAGINTQFAPRDASWGERYFHANDPDGHELSFAKLL
jgi:catechol 2,3-dioxygenase-like lactoylglutathione lyase family enzyme